MNFPLEIRKDWIQGGEKDGGKTQLSSKFLLSPLERLCE